MTILFSPAGLQTYNLGTSLGSTDTTILLSSFLEPVTGTPITMSYMNTTIAFGTLEPKTTNSEFVSFTGITQNANGTALLTGVIRGLAKVYPFTTNAAYKLPHAGQSQFILSDAPQVFQEYVPLNNDVTINGLITFAQPPIGVNPGGAADASTTVKGITKLDTAPTLSTSPIAVGINSALLTTLSGSATSSSNKIVDSSSLATTATNNAVVQANSSGVIDNSFIQTGTTAGKIILLNGSAQIPAVSGALLTNLPNSAIYKNGGTTYNSNTASGTQTIAHGLGKTPLYVRLTYQSNSEIDVTNFKGVGVSWCVYNGTTQSSQSIRMEGTTDVNIDNSFTLNSTQTGGGSYTTGVVSFDSSNISIIWTKTSNPAGTYNITWEAFA